MIVPPSSLLGRGDVPVDGAEGTSPVPEVWCLVSLIVVGSMLLHNFSFVALSLNKVSTETETTGMSVVEFARGVYIAIGKDIMPADRPEEAVGGTAGLVID